MEQAVPAMGHVMANSGRSGARRALLGWWWVGFGEKIACFAQRHETIGAAGGDMETALSLGTLLVFFHGSKRHAIVFRSRKGHGRSLCCPRKIADPQGFKRLVSGRVFAGR